MGSMPWPLALVQKAYSVYHWFYFDFPVLWFDFHPFCLYMCFKRNFGSNSDRKYTAVFVLTLPDKWSLVFRDSSLSAN